MAKATPNPLSDFNYCKTYIGKQVIKPSGKPFKSGQKINTVKDVILHPVLHTPAFTFVEDNSYVSCTQCTEHKFEQTSELSM